MNHEPICLVGRNSSQFTRLPREQSSFALACKHYPS
jgi:hypothetical protein